MVQESALGEPGLQVLPTAHQFPDYPAQRLQLEEFALSRQDGVSKFVQSSTILVQPVAIRSQSHGE